MWKHPRRLCANIHSSGLRPILTAHTKNHLVQLRFMYLHSSARIIQIDLLLTNQVSTFPQSFNNQVMALSPTINISNIVRGSLEMTRGVITLGNENVVIETALKWLVQRDRWSLFTMLVIPCSVHSIKLYIKATYHEFLLNSSETLETCCKLKMMVCRCFGNSWDDSDVVALWTDIVCTRDHGDVDIYRH